MTRRQLETRKSEATIDPGTFAAALDILRARAGLLFPESRHRALETAMIHVMDRARFPDASSLLGALDDTAVFDDLLAEVTVGETYFFRESAQFDLIREEIIPRLISARPDRRIRAWSAACASGEEAYSLAITLIEQRVNAEVLGTDISRPRLQAAQEGSYRKWSLRGVPAAMVDRWFTADGDRFTVLDAARQHTTFGYLNLAEEAYPSLATGAWGMDLILCRNVLIYLDPPTIERVSRALLDSLSTDGWLLLGAADPPLAASMGAEVIETTAGLAYRRAPAGSTGRVTLATPPPLHHAPAPEPSLADLPLASDAAVSSEPMEAPVRTEPGTAFALPDVTTVQPDDVLGAYMRHDYETVVGLIQVTSAGTPPSIAHRILWVRALANLGRLPDAGRVCATALDVHRDVAELHYLHSVLLMESGRPADAAVAAKRALYLDRGMVVAQLAAATAAARSGDPATAVRALASAERLLATLPPDSLVPASDGERASRLLEMTRVQHRLISVRLL